MGRAQKSHNYWLKFWCCCCWDGNFLGVSFAGVLAYIWRGTSSSASDILFLLTPHHSSCEAAAAVGILLVIFGARNVLVGGGTWVAHLENRIFFRRPRAAVVVKSAKLDSKENVGNSFPLRQLCKVRLHWKNIGRERWTHRERNHVWELGSVQKLDWLAGETQRHLIKILPSG